MGKYATKEQLTALVSDMASKINIASGTQGVSGSYVPIGCIEAFMGVEAPPDFLACDGSLHSIASYPQLADHFYEQFGASNYFGGNGTTTFAVPDLRGEFLRGTGTNSHTNQGSGANVGTHQDATTHPSMYGKGSIGVHVTTSNSVQDIITNTDTEGPASNSKYADVMTDTNTPGTTYYTSRPTNTSVLWCIKAIDEKISPNGINYSTDEQNTGLKWIDGKPIYQKTIDYGALPGKSKKTVSIGTSDIDTLVSLNGLAYNPTSKQYMHLSGVSYTTSNLVPLDVAYSNNTWNVRIETDNSNYSSYTKTYITVLYTKTTD